MSLLNLATTVKPFLRITHSAEDVPLQISLDGCEEWLAGHLGVRLNESEDDAVVEEYCQGGGIHLRPTQRPINEVTEVIDRESTAAYTLYYNDERTIWRQDESRWSEGHKRWKVTYNGGYLAATLPNNVQLIILQLMHRMYYPRGGASSDRSMGYSVDWAKFWDSDMMKMASGLMYRTRIG